VAVEAKVPVAVKSKKLRRKAKKLVVVPPEPEAEDFFSTMPGFVPVNKMSKPAAYAAPKKTKEQETREMAARLPQYKFDDVNVDIREADRKTLDGRVTAETDRHEWAMNLLKAERKMLDSTKETDKNIVLLRKGEVALERLMDKGSIRARNIAKRRANKQALDRARPYQPMLEYREPQPARWSRAKKPMLQLEHHKPVRRIPEAVEVPPEVHRRRTTRFPLTKFLARTLSTPMRVMRVTNPMRRSAHEELSRPSIPNVVLFVW
jgi:hypothetical protein